MRISVCEYLRLMTNRNWFYINPGHWGSDGMEFQAKRVDEDSFEITKGRRTVKRLAYFEGLPSNVVRAANKAKKRSR